MRRGDREITDPSAIAEVLACGKVMHLAMCDGAAPYVVPLTYAWRGGVLWAHSAAEGRKLDVLRRNPRVCFDITLDAEIVRNEGRPCDWTTRYRSVIGTGKAQVVTEGPRLREGLAALVEVYGGDAGELPAELPHVVVIRVDVERVSGKSSPV